MFQNNFRASSAPHRSLPDIPNAENDNDGSGSVYETVVHEDPQGDLCECLFRIWKIIKIYFYIFSTSSFTNHEKTD